MTSLLELLGLLSSPIAVKAQLDAAGLHMTFSKDADQPATALESDIFVARKDLSGCVMSITRPTSGLYIVIGLTTIFTIIGPLIAYILYRRQKHKCSFGFDSSSDVGLVLSFVGDGSLQSQLMPLMAVAKAYLSSDSDLSEASPEPPTFQPSSLADGAVRDIECRLNGREVCLVSKAELIQMARDGILKRSDEVRKQGQTWVAAERVTGLFR